MAVVEKNFGLWLGGRHVAKSIARSGNQLVRVDPRAQRKLLLDRVSRSL